jgi:uncharacterized membrane protein YebE (DUF533 family)
MASAKSLLENLLAGTGEIGDSAKAKWNQQSTGAKGAIAGGLLGVLMGGRGGLGGLARVGAAAAIGSVASRAYADWKAGKDPLDSVKGTIGGAIGTLTGAPTDAPETDLTEDFATRLLRAVVAAAKADGHVTEAERARITSQMERLELEPGARAMIEAELAAPLDLQSVADLARTPEEASRIFATSLLLLDRASPQDAAYLQDLAGRMGLDPGLVAHLTTQADRALAGE